MNAEWSQPQLVAANGRRFAGFAAAVLVFIVDPSTRRFLLLRSPAKREREGWETVGGSLEAGETLLDGVAREVAEETGPAVQLRVLGTVHASTWRYDHLIPHMISTFFVASYLGGEVIPGDDMAGCEIRWATLDEVKDLAAAGIALIPAEVWLFDRALQCFDLWSPQDVDVNSNPGSPARDVP
jgi:8-oxo-dGTP pyrophosphatase MutT (NUDIX family)